MKSISFKAPLLALFLGTAPIAGAASFVLTDTPVPGANIPDGSSTGLTRLLNIAAAGESVVSIEISIQIEAAAGSDAFLGDLYIYLTNGSERAVLLNRAGRSAGAPAGYGDNQGMDVTFTTAATDNIHNYRVTLGGPLTGPLTGNWLADGRETDPSAVLDTDAVTAGLEVFDGVNASGDWGLYIADLSSGGEHRLVSWTLNVTTVPEPSALLLSFAAVPLLVRRKR